MGSAEEVVAAASAALGRPLTEPVMLAHEPEWALVLRCTDSAAGEDDAAGLGRTVVVKAYSTDAPSAGCFAAEVSGLILMDGSRLTPRVLAVAPRARTLVMSDLGTGPSVADALLGDSPEAAATALMDWAAGCGRMAALSPGRQAELHELRLQFLAGQADLRHITGLPNRVLGAAEQAARLGVAAPAGLVAELSAVAEAAVSGGPAVFSPGDICPDNTMLTSNGIRFFDFEEAGFHSVFLDAAYIRMPFATCWCVFRLPAELSLEAESAYRDQVSVVWPQLADDGVWRPGVLRASAAWTLSSMSWLLRRCLRGDLSMNPDAPQAPRTRQLMRYRWQWLAAELDAAGDLPVTEGFVRSLLAATDHWQAPGLPVYPALR
jgi:hypothetical protein